MTTIGDSILSYWSIQDPFSYRALPLCIVAYTVLIVCKCDFSMSINLIFLVNIFFEKNIWPHNLFIIVNQSQTSFFLASIVILWECRSVLYVDMLYTCIRHPHTFIASKEQTSIIRPTEHYMMTSSSENIFRVTGPLCGEFTGLRWIPLTKASDAELWYFLWSAPGQTVE